MQNFLLILLLIISCRTGPQNNQLNLALPGDPKNLDPIKSTDVRSGQICSLIYDNLVQFGDSVNIMPCIARKWKISNFGKKYTFYLNTNIKFHNGEKLKAKHVKYSYTRLLNPKNQSSYFWIFDNVIGSKEYLNKKTKEVSGFVCVNDSIFIIELQKAHNPFLSYLAMPPTAIIIQKKQEMIGTGPWILKERIVDGHLLFEKNRNYFDKQPNLDKLKFRILPESFPKTAEYLTGYLDIMEIPDNDYLSWKKDERYNSHIYNKNELNTYYIGLNCSKYPFNNKKIRQAVNYAIDKKKIIEKIFNNKGREAFGPIPPELLKEANEQKYIYNIEKAKQLLNESNIKETIEVDLWQSKSQANSLITEIIQSQLKKINIKVNIKRRDWNMFTQAIRDNKPDMYYRSWYADYPDAENFIFPLFNSTITHQRWNRYHNEEIDKLIELIGSESNIKKRINLIKKANSILIEDAPWIFLWHSQTAYIVNPKLKNWRPKTMYNAEKYISISK